MFEQSDFLEEQAPILEEEEEDADTIQMPVKPDDLSFSWFLLKVVEEGRKFCQLDNISVKRKDLSYHAHLLLAFIIFLVAMIIGSVHLNGCSNERMICIFLIVQGVCGLCIVFVHTAEAFVNCNTICPFRFNTNVVKCIFAFTYCLVIFSIIWFMFGHIWMFRKINVSDNGQFCKTSTSKVTIMILLYEYLIGIWYMGSRIWNNLFILNSLQNFIQHRLHQLRPSIVLEIADTSNDELDEISIVREPTRYEEHGSGIQFAQIRTTYILYIVIGLVLCGIIIILMITSISPAVVLPSQCSTYTTITDSTRRVTYTSCCQNDYSQATGWYRFMDGAGTQLVTTPLSQNNICSATYPGWWNGSLPGIVGSSNVGNICFSSSGSSCADKISSIIATNCGDYYVFYLVQIACCSSYRYCTT
ncbi:hypothetical protein I4U23_003527 [Adineta vaga]|nr:hypothetical protein I4U23_003527 [Adineta vaga]